MSEEFNLEFELDEISLGLEEHEEVDTGMPKNYIHIEKLVMINQVKGFVEDGADLFTVPAYADKAGVPTYVGVIELTSVNVLTMQQLGLKISLIREGKDPVLFDKPEDYVAIVKTLRVTDTVELTDLVEVGESTEELPATISEWDKDEEESA